MRHHQGPPFRLVGLALGLVTFGGLGAPGLAGAQEYEPFIARRLAPASHSFELQLSTGYTQGLGDIMPHSGIGGVAGPGLGVTLDLAYRATRYISVDAEAQYQFYTAENNNITSPTWNASQGLDANIGATVHLRPSHRADPWIRVGTGWRWMWQNQVSEANTYVGALNQFQGWDVLNARVGLDVRSTQNLAWGPVVGADLQTFLFANGIGYPSPQFSAFLYAGVQVRFDPGKFGTDPNAPVR